MSDNSGPPDWWYSEDDLPPGQPPEPSPPAPFSEPTTSRDAAASVAPYRAKQLERIRQFIHQRPSTCDEVEMYLHLKHQTASACLWELAGRRRGARALIVMTDERRPTRSGRLARVYRAL